MGLASDTLAWALQVPAFAERHQTIIFDNRDVGQSSMADGPYEVSDMAQDALALADALELDSFHLLGVSMGGAIAQEMALAAPERIRTLTLAVTWPAGGAWAAQLSTVWGARVQLISREQHIDELMLLNFSEGFFENADGVAWLRGMMLENPHPQPPEAFARQLDASSRHNTRDRLGSLSMPTHVIGAEYDLLVPVWKSRELAERIPGAELTVIEGSPHGANIERAEEFNAAVLDFIAARAAAAGLELRRPTAPPRRRRRVSWIGAARSNSTIWSTRDTGSPLRATTRSSCRRLPSRRTRPNSIATPLESMNSSSLKSTTRPRAERRHGCADRLARGRGAGEVELAGHARDHDLAALYRCRVRPAPSTGPSVALGIACLQLARKPHGRAVRRRRHLHLVHQRAHQLQARARDRRRAAGARRRSRAPRSRSCGPRARPLSSNGAPPPPPACSIALVAASPQAVITSAISCSLLSA